MYKGEGLQAHLGLLTLPQGWEVKCSQARPERNFLAPGEMGSLIWGYSCHTGNLGEHGPCCQVSSAHHFLLYQFLKLKVIPNLLA